MELLESNDFKSELIKKSEKHRADLEGEVRLVTERTEKIITNALIVGGALAVTYFLLNQFSGTKSKPKKGRTKKIKFVHATPQQETEEVVEHVPAAPGVIAQIGTAIASQASVILLDLAKQKLSEYLASRNTQKDQ